MVIMDMKGMSLRTTAEHLLELADKADPEGELPLSQRFYLSHNYVGRPQPTDTPWMIELLQKKDNILMSYKCYESWVKLSRTGKSYPCSTKLQETCAIVTQAILDQFQIHDQMTHIYTRLEEALKLCVMQAHAQLQIQNPPRE